MDTLLAARLQMAVSLGFHIIFASIGMVMPFLMAASHYRYLRCGNPIDRDLTKAWSKGVAIFFAVGAVSGTLLSFELGLLWPRFMEHAGPIFGLPFSWEGTAFFLEAIALGLFLYGWDRLRPWAHWWAGVMVGVAGVASGILVIAANGWMNSPTGFRVVEGRFVDIDPVAAMFNDAWLSQALHMVGAAFAATGFAVAGLHALLLRAGHAPDFHRRALRLALVFGAAASLIQPLTGDFAAKDVARRQPLKLAAMEGQFVTQRRAPLTVGGLPDVEAGVLRFGVELPGMLSFLAYGDFDAEVKGLHDFPREHWPPVMMVHLAFQVMVASGMVLALLSVVSLLGLRRSSRLLENRRFLLLLGAAAPLGFIAIEAGWIVTEVGRQPWIIYGVMLTKDSVTPMPGLEVSLALYIVLYLLLSAVVIWLMKRQIQALGRFPSIAGSSAGPVERG